jgi:N-acetyl-anhydromuramyl-L-alanine amidase AmpD
VAPSRKKDPGELFPWNQLAEEGHGIWPPLLFNLPLQDETKFFFSSRDCLITQQALACIGYHLDPTDSMTEEAELVITAFQRHFLPMNVTGCLDAETVQAIQVVKEAYSDKSFY